MAAAARTVLDCIGNTSLVALHHIVPRSGSRILLKLESENPTGSMKDRPALAMRQPLGHEQPDARTEHRPGAGDRAEQRKLHFEGLHRADYARAAAIRVSVQRTNVRRRNADPTRHTPGLPSDR